MSRVPMVMAFGVPCAVCPCGGLLAVDTGAPLSRRPACCAGGVILEGRPLGPPVGAAAFPDGLPIDGLIGLDALGERCVVDIDGGILWAGLEANEYAALVASLRLAPLEVKQHALGYITCPSAVGDARGEWVVDTGSAVTTRSAEPKACPLRKTVGTLVAGELDACVTAETVEFGGQKPQCQRKVLTKSYLKHGLGGVVGADGFAAVALDRSRPSHPAAAARLRPCAQ